MIFYDFEVIGQDWLVVMINSDDKKETVIVNNSDELTAYYELHKEDIWVGFNSKGYDQYIFKGIILGLNPKEISDYIISGGQGWQFSNAFNKVPMINYDVFNRGTDRGLKVYEGFMGNDITESSVSFDLDRKLTEEEIEETVKYCRHDVEQTIQVFIERYDDFLAHINLIKYAELPLSNLSKTKAQLSAIVLEADLQDRDDEFDIDFPTTLEVKKYTQVLEWYKNNRSYYNGDKKNQLEIMVAGVPHVFGWGGLHGAREKYSGEGYFINMDVASLYPSLMIRYDLLSRNVKNPKKYKEIRDKRLEYKAEKNPLQLPMKIVLNATYGAMKDKYNALYDPRQANRVCVYGQLLLLDLIEKLEPHCDIIQSNTDGILIKLRRYDDYDLIDDICYEWESRTGLQLEFDEYKAVYQKDVNNYIIVDYDGNYKSKGAYVKKLSRLDYDIAIVNKAVVERLVHGVPVEKIINECNSLIDFQLICNATHLYNGLHLDGKPLGVKTARVFATKRGGGLLTKLKKETGSYEKVAGSPEKSKIFNGNINGKPVPTWLDRSFYIDKAKKRLESFGCCIRDI